MTATERIDHFVAGTFAPAEAEAPTGICPAALELLLSTLAARPSSTGRSW